MISHDKISWLAKYIKGWPVLEVRVFGSSLFVDHPNDFDLYIIYDRNRIDEIPSFRERIEEDFKIEFGFHLHLMLISDLEAIESAELIARVVRDSEIIYPQNNL